MNREKCDYCGFGTTRIIPFGSSYLCPTHFEMFVNELEDSPVIKKTLFNSANRILKNMGWKVNK